MCGFVKGKVSNNVSFKLLLVEVSRALAVICGGITMIKQYCYKDFILHINESYLVFYTLSQSCSETIIWEYDIKAHSLKEIYTYGCEMTVKFIEHEKCFLCVSNWPKDIFVAKINEKGELMWRYEIGASISCLHWDKEGNLYFAVNSIWTYCIDSRGKYKWRWRPESSLEQKMPDYTIRDIAVCEDNIFIFYEAQYFILSSAGKTKENFKLPKDLADKPLVVKQDRIIYSNQSGDRLLCYKQKGERIWEYYAGTERKIKGQFLSYNENRIFFVTSENGAIGNLISLDYDGKEAWRAPTECVRGSLYIDENLVYLISEGKVEEYSLEGEKQNGFNRKAILRLLQIESGMICFYQKKGNLSITEYMQETNTELPEIIITKDSESEVMSYEERLEWKNSLVEYLIKTIDFGRNYFAAGLLKEIKIHYEASVYIYPELYMNNLRYFINLDKLDIADMLEVNKETFSDCLNLKTIWQEFCEELSEKEVKSMVVEICNELKEEYLVNINFIDEGK